MTPHLEAAKGDYAETVLLPGDPQRAEWIAENFLSDARRVNNMRAEPGFTGTWRGIRSVCSRRGWARRRWRSTCTSCSTPIAPAR